jgi:hypothetical protein
MNTRTCVQKEHISSAFYKGGVYRPITVCKYIELKRVDRNSRQNGRAANAALPALMRNGPSEQCCELCDQTMSQQHVYTVTPADRRNISVRTNESGKNVIKSPTTNISQHISNPSSGSILGQSHILTEKSSALG